MLFPFTTAALTTSAAAASGSRFAALAYTEVIGAGANFTVSWTPDNKAASLDVCFSGVTGETEWIGLGFSANGKQMNFSDIVVGAPGSQSDAAPTIKTYYSLGVNGYPTGVSTLSISDATYEFADGMATVCFTRPYASGHNPIVEGARGRVIWARGPVTAGALSYHGADGHDDSGLSQSHRSDECNPIGWTNTAPPPYRACGAAEYCCPGGKCAAPTKTSCAVDPTVCAADEDCCPLTKLCVKLSGPCTTTCSDLRSYCCPDALHCLTPVNPGHFCTGPGTQGSCATNQVCCPITMECVSVGAACTPA